MSGEPPRPGWLTRWRPGLSRTAGALSGAITGLFTGRRLDAALLAELEERLIAADLGVHAAARITQKLAKTRAGTEMGAEEVRAALADEIAALLAPAEGALDLGRAKPFVILVVGVNGTGKTDRKSTRLNSSHR